MLSAGGTPSNANYMASTTVRELRPRRKEDGVQGLLVRRPNPGLEGSLLKRMVQVSARSNATNDIGKFISRFDSKKDTKPTASNSR